MAAAAAAGMFLADVSTGQLQAAPVRADAVVLVNSQSARYPDFQHFIQPYLDNFGFPYTVQDIISNAPGPVIGNYAAIIIGHSQFDTNLTYLTPEVQANLSSAVYAGAGLVNFDQDLSTGGVGRYQFVQEVFGFSYGSSVAGSSATLPPTEPASQMHYITALHPTNDVIGFQANITLPGITVPSGGTTLALSGGKPLVAIAQYGEGRAVQWATYAWMPTAVLGPLEGLDDLVWRGVVWAARKPFVMRGLPNLVVLRMDDCSGPFWWAHTANQMGFKPFISFFLNSIDDTEAADLAELATNGTATASVHSFDCCSRFFYFNHAAGAAYSDSVMSNNYATATQWHTSHNVPISKVVAPHYSEIGANTFAGLKNWGVEYVPIEVVPGTIEYASPGAPWLIGGPYRLYEAPQPGQVNRPLWYADTLSVPSHPELDGQFFNCYVEVRDDASCNEWCPANNDVAGSIGRGVRQVKRALDSMAMGQLYTHEFYLIPIPQSQNQTPITSNNWYTILQGVTNGLGGYAPNYVTMDYACQYVRATRTSRLIASSYDSASGQVATVFSGMTDLPTSVYVFVGADSAITSSFGTVPAFAGPVTNVVAMSSGRPMSPAIVTPPASVTTNAGATAAFSVDVVGTVPLGCQWLRDDLPLADGGNISGATTLTLTLTGVTETNAGSYAVVITNQVGSVSSAAAILTVVLPPRFTSITLLADASPLLSLEAVANLTYRIDASTDLTSWTALTNIAPPNAAFQFTDPGATGVLQRYYRAVWVP